MQNSVFLLFQGLQYSFFSFWKIQLWNLLRNIVYVKIVSCGQNGYKSTIVEKLTIFWRLRFFFWRIQTQFRSPKSGNSGLDPFFMKLKISDFFIDFFRWPFLEKLMLFGYETFMNFKWKRKLKTIQNFLEIFVEFLTESNSLTFPGFPDRSVLFSLTISKKSLNLFSLRKNFLAKNNKFRTFQIFRSNSPTIQKIPVLSFLCTAGIDA